MSVPATTLPDNVTRLPSAAKTPPHDLLGEALEYGSVCARSGAFTERNASPEFFALKILLGAEMGLSPMQSVVYLRFERGRPTLDATLIRARLRACGYEYEFVEMTEERAVMRISKGGRVLTPDVSFSKEDAKTAGLLGKDTYQHYLGDMLVARVSSRAARRHAPDAFGGAIYVPGEIVPDGADDGAPGAEVLARAAAAAASAAATEPANRGASAATATATARWNLDRNARRTLGEVMEMAGRLQIARDDVGAQLRRLSGPDATEPSPEAIAQVHRFLAQRLSGAPPCPAAVTGAPSVGGAEKTQSLGSQASSPDATAAGTRWSLQPESRRLLGKIAEIASQLGIGMEDVGAQLRRLSGPEATEPTEDAVTKMHGFLAERLAIATRPAHETGGAARAPQGGAVAKVESSPARPAAAASEGRSNGSGPRVEMEDVNSALAAASRQRPADGDAAAPVEAGAPARISMSDLHTLARELTLDPQDVGRRLRALSGPKAKTPTPEALDALYAELTAAIAAKANGASGVEAPVGEPIPTPRQRGKR